MRILRRIESIVSYDNREISGTWRRGSSLFTTIPPPPLPRTRGTPPPFPFTPLTNRRDLTINSLFYNVNKGTVEDYTGKGTSDLRLGLVRTPLPPCETLLDDPLRALRAVRFASRLGFKVHPELIEAGRDPRVHEALCTKVSCVCVFVCVLAP